MNLQKHRPPDGVRETEEGEARNGSGPHSNNDDELWFLKDSPLGKRCEIQVPDVHSFLAAPAPEHNWAIEGLLENKERVIVTGIEGAGKSTWVRQFAVHAAAGIHPVTCEPIDQAIKVLLVDLENNEAHVRRKLGPLVSTAEQMGRPIPETALIPIIRPEGLDVLNDKDRQWLINECIAEKPQLLCIGPAYKLVGEDLKEEKPARVLIDTLDYIRKWCHSAIVIEAHQKHEQNGQRPQRPYGASIFVRWPEYGMNLGVDGRVSHWRIPREERPWPKRLQRGGVWPWMPADDRKDPPTGDLDVVEIVRTHMSNGSKHSARSTREAVRAAGIRTSNEAIDEARRTVESELSL